MKKMYCDYCKKELKDDDFFCPYCMSDILENSEEVYENNSSEVKNFSIWYLVLFIVLFTSSVILAYFLKDYVDSIFRYVFYTYFQ